MKLYFTWDYTEYPVTEWLDVENASDVPEVYDVMPVGFRHRMRDWSAEMEAAYGDETGRSRPPSGIADRLDSQFDVLAAELERHGVQVVQGEKWWRD